MIASLLADVTPDLIVAAAVVVLVAQPPEQLHGGVALLGRRVLAACAKAGPPIRTASL